MKLQSDLQLYRRFSFFTMVHGMLIFIYIIVYSCSTYIFWCVSGAYIYQCLVSCIVDVIHEECGNVLIVLYINMEFLFLLV